MDNFDSKNFFSKSKPNLVLGRTLKKWERELSQESIQQGGFSEMLSSFYKNYIEPNFFVLFLLLLFVLFLVYKYYSKEDNKDKQEDFIANLNPSSEIALQNSYVRYLPDEVPVIMGGKYVTHNDLDPPQKVPEEYIPHTNYVDNRDSFVGYDNPYKNSIDHTIPHPYGWDTNFNTSTESAIEFSSELNRLSLQGMDENNKVNPISYNDVYKKSDFSKYDVPFTQ